MRECAQAVGATLHVKRQVGQGTQITVRWPSSQQAAAPDLEGEAAGERANRHSRGARRRSSQGALSLQMALRAVPAIEVFGEAADGEEALQV
jgi:hypothetical protein